MFNSLCISITHFSLPSILTSFLSLSPFFHSLSLFSFSFIPYLPPSTHPSLLPSLTTYSLPSLSFISYSITRAISLPSLPLCLPLSLSQAPSDHKNVMSAMWGKLSCSILMQDWETALEDLNRLRRDIDEAVSLQ